MMKMKVILSLMVVIVSNSIVATGFAIIPPKGHVKLLCEMNCQQSMEEPLLSHCERGCRFFYLAQSSELLDLNSTASMSVCTDSCKEAYTDVPNQGACVNGCNKAKEEIDSLHEMNDMIDKVKKEMSVVNLIISSTIWSPFSSSEESDELPENHEGLMPHPIYVFNDALSEINKLDNNPNSDVEIITLVGEDMASVDSEGSSLCATKIWLHRLSFILIVLGALSLLLVSTFYIAAIIKRKKMIIMKRASSDLSDPPSYETLIKDGYIVMSKDIATSIPAKEKDEKLFNA